MSNVDQVTRSAVTKLTPKAIKPATIKEKKSSPKVKTKTPPKKSRKAVLRDDKWTSVMMGIMIPLMVLGCSASVSSLWHTLPWVAVGFAITGVTIMAVSMGHLTDALMAATKSPRRAAFMMALSVDGIIALSELASVGGGGSFITHTMLVAMTAISMRLNVKAFLDHK